MEDDSVNTTQQTQPTSESFSAFASPVSILPLVISLATLVVIVVAACAVYRKRQRRRSQELTRRLRVTERRIDAIEMLKARKEQALAAQKVEYYPPNDVLYASASSVDSERPPHFTLQQPATTVYSRPQEGVCHVSVHTSPHGYEEGSSSYQCSTGRDSSSSQPPFPIPVDPTPEVLDSSLAVECETPSISSLSTVKPAVRARGYRYPKPAATHRRDPRRVHPPPQPIAQEESLLSPSSSFAVSNTGTWGSMSATSSQTQPQPAPSRLGIAPLWQDLPIGEVQGGEGRPNTPATSTVTSATENSGTGTDQGQSDGQREKWV